ncbi:MAG: ATP-binding protein, partial [Planctomycetota bacterium]
DDVVREAVQVMAYSMRRADATVKLSIDPNLSVVQGDPVQLEQVCVNLMKNALEAMEGLPDAERVVKLRLFDRNSNVCLAVEDNGRGITDDDAQRIFDAFFSTKPRGMGMGLSLSKSIAEAHGGEIRCVSRSAESGAVFLLTLPAMGVRPA